MRRESVIKPKETLDVEEGVVGSSDEKENMRRRLLRCCFLPCIDMRDSGGHDVLLYICFGKDGSVKDGKVSGRERGKGGYLSSLTVVTGLPRQLESITHSDESLANYGVN